MFSVDCPNVNKRMTCVKASCLHSIKIDIRKNGVARKYSKRGNYYIC